MSSINGVIQTTTTTWCWLLTKWQNVSTVDDCRHAIFLAEREDLVRVGSTENRIRTNSLMTAQHFWAREKAANFVINHLQSSPFIVTSVMTRLRIYIYTYIVRIFSSINPLLTEAKSTYLSVRSVNKGDGDVGVKHLTMSRVFVSGWSQCNVLVIRYKIDSMMEMNICCHFEVEIKWSLSIYLIWLLSQGDKISPIGPVNSNVIELPWISQRSWSFEWSCSQFWSRDSCFWKITKDDEI